MNALGPGVRVKCVKRDLWVDVEGDPSTGPEFGSIWTIDRIISHYGKYIGPWIILREWFPSGQPFEPTRFVPLDGNEDISALTALLTNLPAIHKEPATV